MTCRNVAAAAVLAALLSNSASAGKCYWLSDAQGGSGGWADSTRWRNSESGGSPVTPQQGDDIYVNSGEAAVGDTDLATLSKGGWLVIGAGGVVRVRISGSYTFPGYLAGLGKFVVESGDVSLARKNSDKTNIEVSGGSLTFPASGPSGVTFGSVAVESPGVLNLPTVSDGHYDVTGLTGNGTVAATGSEKTAILTFVGPASSPFVFSGTLTGKIAPSINGGNQRLTNGGNGNTGDFRFVKGVLGVTHIGNSGEPGSFGTSTIWTLNGGSSESATLCYLGSEHETTTRSFVLSGTPRNEIVLDGGENGVTFAGEFGSGSNIAGSSFRLALAGSATAVPSRFTGKFPGEGSGGVIHVAKRGSGTWLFPENATAPNYNGCFAVEEGTLAYESLAEAGTRCSLGYATSLYERYSGAVDASRTVPWAYLLGNGTDSPDGASLATFEYVGSGNLRCSTRPIALKGTARVRNSTAYAFDFSGVTSSSAGEHTLVLDGAGHDNVIKSLTNGIGTVSVVKEGAGTWTLDGDVDISGGIDVKEGSLKYKWRQNYTWFKLSFKSSQASGNIIKFGHIGFFAEDGTEQALNLTYNSGAVMAVSKLRPGEVTFGSNSEGASGSKDTLETLFAPYRNDVHKDMRNIDYRALSPSDSTSWIVVVLRLPADAAPVVKYDMMTGWYKNSTTPYDGTVTQWLVEGSVDGVDWHEIETGERDLKYSGSGNYWMSDGTLWNNGSNPNPKGFAVSTDPASPTYRKMSSLSSLTIASGANFATDGSVLVSRLGLDCLNGCGNATGVAFAAEGTLSLSNLPDEHSVFVPVPFASADGFAGVAGWNLEINGVAQRTGRYIVDVTPSGIRISKRGVILYVH